MGYVKKTMGAFALAALLVSAFQTLGAAEMPFATARITKKMKSLERQFEGTVEAVNKTTISAQTSGLITEIDVDVNDFVEKNAIIVRLNDAEHKSRLNQALSAQIAAKSRAAAAEKDFNRVKPLFKSGTVARSRYDNANSAFETSRADLQKADAAVAQAREQLSYTIVRAPYSGFVANRHVEIGEMASPGKPLMTGFSLEKLRVRSEVPEQYARKIRKSNMATIISGDGEKIGVKKLTVFPFADPKSNTVTIRLELPAGTTTVFPGMLVKARFKVGEVDVLVMPGDAIVTRGEVTGAYLIDANSRVHLQQIRTGKIYSDGSVEVLSGLKEGDQVALAPLKAAIFLKQSVGEKK